MPVSISGGSPAYKHIARQAYDRVMAVFPWNGDISIYFSDWPGRHETGEASCQSDGVYVLPEAAERSGPDRTEYLLYEEIGHFIVSKMGLSHEDLLGVFFQELFAGYLKFKLAVTHHDLSGRILMPPLPGEEDHHVLFHSLGTDLGAALAGVAQADALLDEWICDLSGLDEASAALRQFVKEIRDDLRTAIASGADVPTIAQRCIALHAQAQAGANAAAG